MEITAFRRLARTSVLAMILTAALSGSAAGQGIRIFGISYPDGSRRAVDGELIDVPTRVTPDERYARFPLTVGVRNYGTSTARYQLHLRLDGYGKVSPSPMLEVMPGTVRREPYTIGIDFALRWDAPDAPAGGTSLAAPTPIILLPSNPVRATLRLLSESGAVVDSQAFNLILSRPPPPFRHTRDLMVERVEFVHLPPSAITERAMYARIYLRNVGRETWGFRGEVSAHLQQGTPETRLIDIGGTGMPTMPMKPLPGGLEPTSADSVALKLESRFTSTGPIGGGRLMRVTPPLRPGLWYTLTGWTASEADVNPTNDSVQLIFMLDDDMTIRESRTRRVTNRVRVIAR